MVLVAMSIDQHPPLQDDSRWLEQTGRVLANLGFELIEPDRSTSDETRHLLVALRPQPTLHHFDPEIIDYWVCDGSRGRPARLDSESRFPVVAEYAWGRISLTDRDNVKNEFLSFGGAMRAQTTADTTVLVDFSSDAPILRWSGHSQTSDPLASELGAFFARIKVPIDFMPGAETLIAKAAPSTLYCAFIQNVRRRLGQAHTLRDANHWLAEWSSRESQRVETSAGDHWAAATELRRQLGMIEPGDRG